MLLYLRSIYISNDTATAEIYTLSLHDALPISQRVVERVPGAVGGRAERGGREGDLRRRLGRGAELQPADPPAQVERLPGDRKRHTSELQSQSNLVCRLLLEKKNTASTHTLWLI